MKKCKRCGFETMDEKVRFCHNCGGEMEEVVTKNETSQLIQEVTVEKEVTQEKSGGIKNKKKRFITATIIGVVIVFAFLILTHTICIKHKYSDATVLEPQTCIYCDKTKGEPKPLSEFEWPSKGVGSLLPVPKSNMGEIIRDDFDSFKIYVGETSINDYSAYIKECSDSGFDVEYRKDEDSYSAYDVNGNELDIWYEGNNIMKIQIRAADEEEIEEDSTDEVLSSEQGENIEQTDCEALGHEWIDATCTESKTCSVCGETDGEALGHTKGDWTLTQEATLVEVGVEEILCSVCGESLDSRGTERKNPRVDGTSFNFKDEEFIDWINDLSKASVSYTEFDLGMGSANTAYQVTMPEGDKGALILNHESDEKISAIMCYFEDYTNAAALTIWIGTKIDSDFSSDDAMEPVANNQSYTAAEMTVTRLNLDDDFEVALLAPTDLLNDILNK